MQDEEASVGSQHCSSVAPSLSGVVATYEQILAAKHAAEKHYTTTTAAIKRITERIALQEERFQDTRNFDLFAPELEGILRLATSPVGPVDDLLNELGQEAFERPVEASATQSTSADSAWPLKERIYSLERRVAELAALNEEQRNQLGRRKRMFDAIRSSLMQEVIIIKQQTLTANHIPNFSLFNILDILENTSEIEAAVTKVREEVNAEMENQKAQHVAALSELNLRHREEMEQLRDAKNDFERQLMAAPAIDDLISVKESCDELRSSLRAESKKRAAAEVELGATKDLVDRLRSWISELERQQSNSDGSSGGQQPPLGRKFSEEIERLVEASAQEVTMALVRVSEEYPTSQEGSFLEHLDQASLVETASGHLGTTSEVSRSATFSSSLRDRRGSTARSATHRRLSSSVRSPRGPTAPVPKGVKSAARRPSARHLGVKSTTTTNLRSPKRVTPKPFGDKHPQASPVPSPIPEHTATTVPTSTPLSGDATSKQDAGTSPHTRVVDFDEYVPPAKDRELDDESNGETIHGFLRLGFANGTCRKAETQELDAQTDPELTLLATREVVDTVEAETMADIQCEECERRERRDSILATRREARPAVGVNTDLTTILRQDEGSPTTFASSSFVRKDVVASPLAGENDEAFSRSHLDVLESSVAALVKAPELGGDLADLVDAMDNRRERAASSSFLDGANIGVVSICLCEGSVAELESLVETIVLKAPSAAILHGVDCPKAKLDTDSSTVYCLFVICSPTLAAASRHCYKLLEESFVICAACAKPSPLMVLPSGGGGRDKLLTASVPEAIAVLRVAARQALSRVKPGIALIANTRAASSAVRYRYTHDDVGYSHEHNVLPWASVDGAQLAVAPGDELHMITKSLSSSTVDGMEKAVDRMESVIARPQILRSLCQTHPLLEWVGSKLLAPTFTSDKLCYLLSVKLLTSGDDVAMLCRASGGIPLHIASRQTTFVFEKLGDAVNVAIQTMMWAKYGGSLGNELKASVALFGVPLGQLCNAITTERWGAPSIDLHHLPLLRRAVEILADVELVSEPVMLVSGDCHVEEVVNAAYLALEANCRVGTAKGFAVSSLLTTDMNVWQLHLRNVQDGNDAKLPPPLDVSKKDTTRGHVDDAMDIPGAPGFLSYRLLATPPINATVSAAVIEVANTFPDATRQHHVEQQLLFCLAVASRVSQPADESSSVAVVPTASRLLDDEGVAQLFAVRLVVLSEDKAQLLALCSAASSIMDAQLNQRVKITIAARPTVLLSTHFTHNAEGVLMLSDNFMRNIYPSLTRPAAPPPSDEDQDTLRIAATSAVSLVTAASLWKTMIPMTEENAGPRGIRDISLVIEHDVAADVGAEVNFGVRSDVVVCWNNETVEENPFAARNAFVVVATSRLLSTHTSAFVLSLAQQQQFVEYIHLEELPPAQRGTAKETTFSFTCSGGWDTLHEFLDALQTIRAAVDFSPVVFATKNNKGKLCVGGAFYSIPEAILADVCTINGVVYSKAATLRAPRAIAEGLACLGSFQPYMSAIHSSLMLYSSTVPAGQALDPHSESPCCRGQARGAHLAVPVPWPVQHQAAMWQEHVSIPLFISLMWIAIPAQNVDTVAQLASVQDLCVLSGNTQTIRDDDDAPYIVIVAAAKNSQLREGMSVLRTVEKTRKAFLCVANEQVDSSTALSISGSPTTGFRTDHYLIQCMEHPVARRVVLNQLKASGRAAILTKNAAQPEAAADHPKSPVFASRSTKSVPFPLARLPDGLVYLSSPQAPAPGSIPAQPIEITTTDHMAPLHITAPTTCSSVYVVGVGLHNAKKVDACCSEAMTLACALISTVAQRYHGAVGEGQRHLGADELFVEFSSLDNAVDFGADILDEFAGAPWSDALLHDHELGGVVTREKAIFGQRGNIDGFQSSQLVMLRGFRVSTLLAKVDHVNFSCDIGGNFVGERIIRTHPGKDVCRVAKNRVKPGVLAVGTALIENISNSRRAGTLRRFPSGSVTLSVGGGVEPKQIDITCYVPTTRPRATALNDPLPHHSALPTPLRCEATITVRSAVLLPCSLDVEDATKVTAFWRFVSTQQNLITHADVSATVSTMVILVLKRDSSAQPLQDFCSSVGIPTYTLRVGDVCITERILDGTAVVHLRGRCIADIFAAAQEAAAVPQWRAAPWKALPCPALLTHEKVTILLAAWSGVEPAPALRSAHQKGAVALSLPPDVSCMASLAFPHNVLGGTHAAFEVWRDAFLANASMQCVVATGSVLELFHAASGLPLLHGDGMLVACAALSAMRPEETLRCVDTPIPAEVISSVPSTALRTIPTPPPQVVQSVVIKPAPNAPARLVAAVPKTLVGSAVAAPHRSLDSQIVRLRVQYQPQSTTSSGEFSSAIPPASATGALLCAVNMHDGYTFDMSWDDAATTHTIDSQFPSVEATRDFLAHCRIVCDVFGLAKDDLCLLILDVDDANLEWEVGGKAKTLRPAGWDHDTSSRLNRALDVTSSSPTSPKSVSASVRKPAGGILVAMERSREKELLAPTKGATSPRTGLVPKFINSKKMLPSSPPPLDTASTDDVERKILPVACATDAETLTPAARAHLATFLATTATKNIHLRTGEGIDMLTGPSEEGMLLLQQQLAKTTRHSSEKRRNVSTFHFPIAAEGITNAVATSRVVGPSVSIVDDGEGYDDKDLGGSASFSERRRSRKASLAASTRRGSRDVWGDLRVADVAVSTDPPLTQHRACSPSPTPSTVSKGTSTDDVPVADGLVRNEPANADPELPTGSGGHTPPPNPEDVTETQRAAAEQWMHEPVKPPRQPRVGSARRGNARPTGSGEFSLSPYASSSPLKTPLNVPIAVVEPVVKTSTHQHSAHRPQSAPRTTLPSPADIWKDRFVAAKLPAHPYAKGYQQHPVPQPPSTGEDVPQIAAAGSKATIGAKKHHNLEQ